MSALILAMLGIAAVGHAGWNALIKASDDPLDVSTRAVISGTLLALPPVAVAWFLTGRPGMLLGGWLLALVSAAVELAYFVFLSEAYRRGDLSVVYPVARGSAPLLAVVIGLVVLGERLRPLELAGVLCLLAGIWAVRKPAAAGKALAPALATGVMIALYSDIDRVGVRLGPPWLYGWALWLFTAILLALLTRLHTNRGSKLTPDWPRSIAAGSLMTLAYFLVLFALSLAPLSVVAPLRESAIVLVTAWGVFGLGERRGAWLRLGGAGAIVIGVALLAAA
jgi:drug/metabolite transporter (DMT)-like permease